jgi:hypothetical protein
MKNFTALVFTGIFAVPAFSATIAPASASICTRDFNPWGHASQCECPSETRYERRVGQCIQGQAVEISIEGSIVPARNDEGDVVAYKVTKSGAESFKIVLPLALRERFASETYQDVKFRLKGDLIESFDGQDLEPTLIVERIEAL